MNRTYTMPRGIKFQNLIIDEEGKVNARQSLVFRNECSLEEINKLIGTSFSPNSLLFEGQKRLEDIFAKLRELNIDSHITISDREEKNLAWESGCIGSMLENAKKISEQKKAGYHVNMMYFKCKGFFYEDKILLLVPDSKNPEQTQLINLTKTAKKFAEIENSFSIIIIDGDIKDMRQYETVMENFEATISDKQAQP